MKNLKSILLCLIAVCMVFLGGCGEKDKENNIKTGRDYFMVRSEEFALPTPEESSGWQLLGMQFLDGEAIQFWGEKKVDEQLHATWDVHLYHEDGSKEFLFGGVSGNYRSGFRMDDEGKYYVLFGKKLIKLDENGKELYCCTFEETLYDLYQNESGQWMLLGKSEAGVVKAFELNAETGENAEKWSVVLEDEGVQYFAGKDDGFYVINGKGVWAVNAADGNRECVLSFEETGYAWQGAPMDYRVTAEGTVEVLQAGKRVILKCENLGETRGIIVLAGWNVDFFLEEYVQKFNEENTEYYVIIEEGAEKDSSGDPQIYKQRMGVEVAAGGGPDLMLAGGTVENELELREKGVFEKLNSYLENAGIQEEDYFPVAFDALRDGEDIYGITLWAKPAGYWVYEEVLAGKEVQNVEDLLDALLAYEEEAVFHESWEAEWLLNRLLVASETLFGMVDWEKGTCDFEGELFTKLLQVSKRYGAKENNTLPAIAGWMDVDSFYSYESLAQLQSEGKVAICSFFDDGCRMGSISSKTMVINSNSTVKAGAWEFIRYLLEGELQTELLDSLPVKKSGFDIQTKREIEEGSILKYIGTSGRENYKFKAGISEYKNNLEALNDYDNYRANHDLTETTASEIRQFLEGTRAYPVRIEPILEIISEEVGAYYADAKSIEEVCKTIENRVQLYLDEHN